MLALLGRMRPFASNRSQSGLWHGKDVRKGRAYTFSHKGTKRMFKPNIIKNKKLWSHILDRWIILDLSTKALRCIEKKGNLDNYLL
jgi:ribosomal protein L28